MTLKEKLLDMDLCIDNEYLDKYVELIESNRETKREKFKTQRHHIIPRYYWKYKNLEIDNSKENLVNLLYKDHILAHYYLYLCSKYNLFKWLNACSVKYCLNYNDTLVKHLTNDEIEILLPKIQELYEDIKINSSINNKDYKHTEKAKQLISQASQNRKHMHKDNVMRYVKDYEVSMYLELGWSLGGLPQKETTVIKRREKLRGHVTSEETRNKISKSLLGHKVSQEARMKSSNKQKGKSRNNRGKIYVHNGEQVKNIFKEELNSYLQLGWSTGNPKASSYSTKGTVWMNDGERNYMIKKILVNYYLERNYKYGRIK